MPSSEIINQNQNQKQKQNQIEMAPVVHVPDEIDIKKEKLTEIKAYSGNNELYFNYKDYLIN